MERKTEVCFGFCAQKQVRLADVSQTLGWQISQFNIPELWTETRGEGVKVAVIDTGVDSSHPDLTFTGTFDFVGAANGTPISYIPTVGHGTHVSGIIAAQNNDFGIVGVAPFASLYSCRVLSDDGYGSWYDIVKALDWCITNHIDVVNMSLGGDNPGEEVYLKFREVYDAGITIVCAGGNDSWDYGYLSFPAIYNETIAVAATNASMTRAWFSSVGSNIDIGAPGENIVSCTPGNTYASYSGTSMATPFVSGVVALMISKHRKYGGNTPIKTVEDVRSHLNGVADDVDFKGQDIYLGYGIIDPHSSVDSVHPEAAESLYVADGQYSNYDKTGMNIYGNSTFAHGIIYNWNDK